MTDVNYLAVLVATVTAFLLSGAWYAGFGNQLAKLSSAYAEGGRSPAWTVLAELVRSFVVATVVAGLAAQIGIESWSDAIALGVGAWIGFPAMILAGSVVHEKVPARLAGIHAGDWLVKLTAITLIVGLWQ